MSEYTLVVGDEKFYLAELEFYLNCEHHPDIFAHSNEDQMTTNEWYFHRMGKKYRGGNYKGLDITFSKEGYGGILIRAIKNVNTGEYIDGPCKVVDKILDITKNSSIQNLVDHEEFNFNVFH